MKPFFVFLLVLPTVIFAQKYSTERVRSMEFPAERMDGGRGPDRSSTGDKQSHSHDVDQPSPTPGRQSIVERPERFTSEASAASIAARKRIAQLIKNTKAIRNLLPAGIYAALITDTPQNFLLIDLKQIDLKTISTAMNAMGLIQLKAIHDTIDDVILELNRIVEENNRTGRNSENDIPRAELKLWEKVSNSYPSQQFKAYGVAKVRSVNGGIESYVVKNSLVLPHHLGMRVNCKLVNTQNKIIKMVIHFTNSKNEQLEQKKIDYRYNCNGFICLIRTFQPSTDEFYINAAVTFPFDQFSYVKDADDFEPFQLYYYIELYDDDFIGNIAGSRVAISKKYAFTYDPFEQNSR